MRSWVSLLSAYNRRNIGHVFCDDCNSNRNENKNSRSRDYGCTEEVVGIIVIATGTLSVRASIQMGACRVS